VLKSNFSHEGYLKAVAAAREYICAGDIFQVNLSQRLEVALDTPPYELYKRLRRINPPPSPVILTSMASVSPALRRKGTLKSAAIWWKPAPSKALSRAVKPRQPIKL